MALAENRDYGFGEYVRQGEPGQAEKAAAWQTAVGLQAVDGLQASEYLIETARQHIEGDLHIEEVQSRIEAYYEERTAHGHVDDTAMEADLVSARIAKLLGERAFTFSPVQLRSIHKALFEGLIPEAGSFRSYNITKREWVLDGDTVYYASSMSIEETLGYDFSQEKAFRYEAVSESDAIRHIASFVSGIWQIHPFCEGNTRTAAVFAIKYLNAMGYEVNNAMFERHSWYFRNALVRANYSNHQAGITATQRYLDMFFENLLLGTDHELKNRFMHVGFDREKTPASNHAEKASDNLKRILKALGEDELTTKEIMGKLELSDRNNFMKSYLNPAIDAGLVERTMPEKPKSPQQRYRKAKRAQSYGERFRTGARYD